LQKSTMPVLIVKNIASEGPGTLAAFFKQKKIPFTLVELGSGETPPSLDKYSALIILGGPMGVYEMEQYPHLVSCSRLIREAINRNMNVLGICLGSQMIAYCLGAEVYPGHGKEVGWLPVELTGEGLKDQCMRKLAMHPRVGDFWRKFKVLHWHGDTFDLPPGAVLLASSSMYRHQAFRYGDKVYGFQFHMEVTKEMIADWFRDIPEYDKIIGETESIFDEYHGRAMNFYKDFFSK